MEINNTDNVVKQRNTGIDLLRIVAIILICIFHANLTLRYKIDFENSSFTNIVSSMFIPFGDIGNILFIICSSYFLSTRKINGIKAIHLCLNSLVVSIIFLLFYLIFGTNLSAKEIVWQIFPDVFLMNWFVPVYVIYYLLSPIIIFGLRSLSRKNHFFVVFLLFAICGLLSIFNLEPGDKLFSFFLILCTVSFLRWHFPNYFLNKRKHILIFVFGMMSFYLLFFISLLIKSKFGFTYLNVSNLISPLLLVPLLSLFSVFLSFKFRNRFIEYVSNLSFLVYIIHENYLFRTYTRPYIFSKIIENFGLNYIVLWVILIGLAMFLVSIALAIIYKLIFEKLLKLFAEKIYSLINKAAFSIYNCFFGN